MILAGLTLLLLLLSIPGSLRDTFSRGGIYLFSQEFIEDIPRRLTGPGRFRFVIQPLIAVILVSSVDCPTRGPGGLRISTGYYFTVTSGAIW